MYLSGAIYFSVEYKWCVIYDTKEFKNGGCTYLQCFLYYLIRVVIISYFHFKDMSCTVIVSTLRLKIHSLYKLIEFLIRTPNSNA